MKWYDPRLVFAAARTILLSGRGMRWAFVLLALLFYLLYLVLPVLLIPGNYLGLQLQILRLSDHVQFVFLAVVTALLILMQVYLLRRTRRAEQAAAVGRGGVGVWSAIFGGLLASAACSSCIAAILGFLGAGSVFFIVDHRSYFVASSFAVVVVALLLTARRIQGYCERCGVPIGGKAP